MTVMTAARPETYWCRLSAGASVGTRWMLLAAGQQGASIVNGMSFVWPGVAGSETAAVPVIV